jgi:hypothetical protein
VASDSIRRCAAHDVVGWSFADTAEQQFGAGPLFAFDPDPGEGDLNALQTISVPDPHVYDPDLQLNGGNEVHGDLVSGFFDPSQPAIENSDYTRFDFTPGAAMSVADCAESMPGSEPIGDDAFLVRLRRTNDFDGLDQLAGISSSGPAVPLLFGRGALISKDPDADYNPRVHGITVRATAIAQARPALRVGMPHPDLTVPGVTPFALTSAFAATISDDPLNPTSATVDAEGFLMSSGVEGGQFVADPLGITTVGQELCPRNMPSPDCAPAALPPADWCIPGIGFAPVHQPVGDSAALRVVGFISVTVTCSSPTDLALTRGPQVAVASANATALLIYGLPLTVPAEDRSLVLGFNQGLAATQPAAVLAPVLVR